MANVKLVGGMPADIIQENDNKQFVSKVEKRKLELAKPIKIKSNGNGYFCLKETPPVEQRELEPGTIITVIYDDSSVPSGSNGVMLEWESTSRALDIVRTIEGYSLPYNEYSWAVSDRFFYDAKQPIRLMYNVSNWILIDYPFTKKESFKTVWEGLEVANAYGNGTVGTGSFLLNKKDGVLNIDKIGNCSCLLLIEFYGGLTYGNNSQYSDLREFYDTALIPIYFYRDNYVGGIYPYNTYPNLKFSTKLDFSKWGYANVKGSFSMEIIPNVNYVSGTVYNVQFQIEYNYDSEQTYCIAVRKISAIAKDVKDVVY